MEELKIKLEIDGEIRTATLYKGKPYGEDPPERWGKSRILGHNIGNSYNPSWIEYFPEVNKYLIYRDGCFYPYVGKIKILDY